MRMEMAGDALEFREKTRGKTPCVSGALFASNGKRLFHLLTTSAELRELRERRSPHPRSETVDVSACAGAPQRQEKMAYVAQNTPYQQPAYQQQYDPEMGGYGKPEDEGGYADFMDKQIRQGFIRKVFSILAVQLLVTFGCAIGFASSAPLKSYLMQNAWPFYIAFPALIGSMIGIACCGDLHRRFPHNYALLGVFTLANSYLVGVTTLQYDTETVLMAVAITAGITLALTLFAFQTKYDFTTAGGFLLCALLALFSFSILSAILPYNKMAHIAFASAGALLFSCYLVYDIQIMMDGKRIQISPDDYVLAALNLYLDIINLFLYILQILGDR